jgi:hypothetical protein
MRTKRHMSSSSSCFIELHSSHRPFVLSCITIDLSSTSSPMQTTNHPLVPLPIVTNHTPHINSLYRPLAFCVNVGPWPYTFQGPLDHAQVGPFPPSTISTPIVPHDRTPQPSPISSTYSQLPLKVFCPTYGHQFTN